MSRTLCLAILLAGIGLAPALAGCGYRPLTSSVAAEDRPQVAIRTFANESSEPGVELLVSDAVRRTFLTRGDWRLVEDPERADFVIQGRVRPIRDQAKSFSSVVLSLESTITLDVDIDVSAADGERLKLDEQAFRDSELYLASADVEATRKNRREALQRVADLIAGRLHDAMVLETVQ